VTANQVFYCRKLYREGRLGRSATELLSVKVTDEPSPRPEKWSGVAPRPGSMEIELRKGTLRMASAVDVVALRAVLEYLAG